MVAMERDREWSLLLLMKGVAQSVGHQFFHRSSRSNCVKTRDLSWIVKIVKKSVNSNLRRIREI